MIMEKQGFVTACALLGSIAYLMLGILLALVTARWPVDHVDRQFVSVNDRPVIEDLDRLWEARTTRTATFKFDGTLYVVENLPKEYIAYSSKMCREP